MCQELWVWVEGFCFPTKIQMEEDVPENADGKIFRLVEDFLRLQVLVD